MNQKGNGYPARYFDWLGMTPFMATATQAGGSTAWVCHTMPYASGGGYAATKNVSLTKERHLEFFSKVVKTNALQNAFRGWIASGFLVRVKQLLENTAYMPSDIC